MSNQQDTPQIKTNVQNSRIRIRDVVLVVLASAGTVAVISSQVIAPFAWLSLLWTGVFAVFTRGGAWPMRKAAWLQLSIVVLSVGAFEFAMDRILPAYHKRRVYSNGLYQPHEHLGYTNKPNVRTSETCLFRDEVIYKVKYTTNGQGMRIVPTAPKHLMEGAVAFGGSFTFGMGVTDEEAWPSVLAHNGRYRVGNFGVNGYGPHQMLTAIEHGIVEQNFDFKPKFGIYLGIPHHLERIVGLVSWGRHAPRYVLSPEGDLRFGGHFDDGCLLPEKLVHGLLKSHIIDQLRVFDRNGSQISADDKFALYVAIVDRARKEFEKRFTGSEFHMLYWDVGDELYGKRICRELRSRGVRLHLISEMIPEITDKRSQFVIEHDEHPKPECHRRIAEFVQEHILR